MAAKGKMKRNEIREGLKSGSRDHLVQQVQCDFAQTLLNRDR